MSNKDGDPNIWASTDFKDYADCTKQVTNAVQVEEIFFFGVSMLISVHFCHVLFTHYQKSGLTKALGGCQPDGPADAVQMAAGQFDTSVTIDNTVDNDVRAQVQHAVDDETLRHTQQMS